MLIREASGFRHRGDSAFGVGRSAFGVFCLACRSSFIPHPFPFHMTRTLTAKIALAIAGSSSAAMGAYHFFLPSMFHWDRFVTKVPDSIQWALFSINFFFSYLLLAGGILTLVALR